MEDTYLQAKGNLYIYRSISFFFSKLLTEYGRVELMAW